MGIAISVVASRVYNTLALRLDAVGILLLIGLSTRAFLASLSAAMGFLPATASSMDVLLAKEMKGR